MKTNPRNYPDTMVSTESGRSMTRGNKAVIITIEGRKFSYNQPGWWCSLTDPDDMEGEMVDGDNQVREMARRTAKALAAGETLFVPVVIRAIRERCGLSQKEAGQLFGGGAKSFEKYESGEIRPSGPTRRLLEIAIDRPQLFQLKATASRPAPKTAAKVWQTLHAATIDAIYAPLFGGVDATERDLPALAGKGRRRRQKAM